MRPLVIRYRKLGDTLMVTPILQALADAGSDGVYTVGERAWERVFTSHPAVRGNVNVEGGSPRTLELVRAGLEARRFRCDTAITLRFSRRAGLVARLAGCRVRAGASENPVDRLAVYTQNTYDREFFKNSHQVEKYYRVAEAATGSLPRLPTYYRPRDGAGDELGALPGRFAVVHVGSGGSNMGWPDASYRATVEGLRALGLTVVVSGAAEDGPRHPETCAAADLDVVGRTDLDALAALFMRARLVVGLDGGATRVASAVGSPVVALSISHRWAYRQIVPWMAPGVLLEPARRCPGCSVHHCSQRGQVCAENLSPEAVLSASRDLLGG